MRKSYDFDKPFPFKFLKNEDNSGFLLWKVSYMWQQEQRRTLLKYHNISQMDYVILSSTYYLMVTEKKITPTILARHTKIATVGVAQLLNSLEERKLIERYSKEGDGKSRFVRVSDLGLEVLKKAIITVEAFDDRFFKAIGTKIGIMNKFMTDLIKTNE